MRIKTSSNSLKKELEITVLLNDDDLKTLSKNGIISMEFEFTRLTVVMDKDS